MKSRLLFGRSPLIGVSVKREFTVYACMEVPKLEEKMKIAIYGATQGKWYVI